LLEEVTPYVINNATEEQVELLMKANNTFINIDRDVEHALVLMSALCSREDADPAIDKRWHALWEKCNTTFPVDGPLDFVVCSGYYG
jgi:hypothetical protein